jgi:hypothetical protein
MFSWFFGFPIVSGSVMLILGDIIADCDEDHAVDGWHGLRRYRLNYGYRGMRRDGIEPGKSD